MKARLFHLTPQGHIRAARQRGFEREVLPLCRQFCDAFENGAPRAQHACIWVEGRKGPGQQIGVDEVAAVDVARQEFGGERRFTRPIRSGDDVTFRLFDGHVSCPGSAA
jgi:hypothetical protein